MGRDGTYDDEITLCAIDNIFDRVVSTLAQQRLSDRKIRSHYLESSLDTLLKVRVSIMLFWKSNSTPQKLIEEQSDLLGGKSQLITDKTNSGENKIYLSENNINSGENEIDRSEKDINLGENEINLPENKLFSDEKELDPVPIEFERAEDDFEVEQNEINHAENNNTNLRIKGTESNTLLDWLPLDILEKIFFYALSQSDYTFPGHVCYTFQKSINGISGLNAFKKKGQRFLPRIYINRENTLPKANEETGEITVNVKR